MTQDLPLHIVQITDTHLFADEDRDVFGVPTAKSLRAVLDRLKQLQPQPDLLLMTGDLSQDETAESYIRLRDLIAPLHIPTYWLRGNHDQFPAIEDVLKAETIFAEKSIQLRNWNLILLNSMMVGQVGGELSPDELDWLDQQLQAFRDRPTLISLHHPPLPVGSDWMDTIGLQNSDALFQVLDRHPQVKLVLFGHVHQEFVYERQGVHYLSAPSTCVQFKPKSREFTVDERKPGLRVLTLHSDGSYTTRVERVDFVAA